MSPTVEADSTSGTWFTKADEIHAYLNYKSFESYHILIYPHTGIKLHNQTYDIKYFCHNNSQSHSENAPLLGSIL